VVPTYEPSSKFDDDWERLSDQQRERFMKAVNDFKADLAASAHPRPGLRVKKVKATPGVFELTWAPDGRATWSYGDEKVPGEPHIVWRRIGSHDIFKNP
jgi:hypothetical protein